MSRFMKRIVSALIAVIMMASIALPQAAFASAERSVFYYQRDAKWGYGRAGYSACYLSSFAMILTNMGIEDATPADVYRVNNYSSYMIQSRITNKYDVSWNRMSVYGKSSSYKMDLVKELLEENPQGVIVRNSGHTMIATRLTKKGNIVFNDPAYPDGYELFMSQTQLGSWGVISYIETIQ